MPSRAKPPRSYWPSPASRNPQRSSSQTAGRSSPVWWTPGPPGQPGREPRRNGGALNLARLSHISHLCAMFFLMFFWYTWKTRQYFFGYLFNMVVGQKPVAVIQLTALHTTLTWDTPSEPVNIMSRTSPKLYDQIATIVWTKNMRAWSYVYMYI